MLNIFLISRGQYRILARAWIYQELLKSMLGMRTLLNPFSQRGQLAKLMGRERERETLWRNVRSIHEHQVAYYYYYYYYMGNTHPSQEENIPDSLGLFSDFTAAAVGAGLFVATLLVDFEQLLSFLFGWGLATLSEDSESELLSLEREDLELLELLELAEAPELFSLAELSDLTTWDGFDIAVPAS